MDSYEFSCLLNVRNNFVDLTDAFHSIHFITNYMSGLFLWIVFIVLASCNHYPSTFQLRNNLTFPLLQRYSNCRFFADNRKILGRTFT